MPARKVLNNNVVIVIDDHGREQVLMGRGIGFGLKPDDELDMARVEKTFILEDDADRAYIEQLMADAPYEVIEGVSDAMAAAEASLGRELPKHVAIAVIDHVSFLVRRLRENIRIPAAPMPEMAVLYPDEYAAAQRMAAAIAARLGRELPEEESIFLTMHLLNASRDERNGSADLLLRRVQRALAIVEERYAIAVDPASPAYARFVLHLKFLLYRLATDTMLDGPDNSFYEFARKAHPRAHTVAQQFKDEVIAASGISLTNEEMLYLTMHIERLASQFSPPRTSESEQNVQ